MLTTVEIRVHPVFIFYTYTVTMMIIIGGLPSVSTIVYRVQQTSYDWPGLFLNIRSMVRLPCAVACTEYSLLNLSI